MYNKLYHYYYFAIALNLYYNFLLRLLYKLAILNNYNYKLNSIGTDKNIPAMLPE